MMIAHAALAELDRSGRRNRSNNARTQRTRKRMTAAMISRRTTIGASLPSYTRAVNPGALDVLEFPAIRERIAAAAATDHGAELAHALTPSPDPGEVTRRQALTAEAIALLDESARAAARRDPRRARACLPRGARRQPRRRAHSDTSPTRSRVLCACAPRSRSRTCRSCAGSRRRSSRRCARLRSRSTAPSSRTAPTCATTPRRSSASCAASSGLVDNASPTSSSSSYGGAASASISRRIS